MPPSHHHNHPCPCPPPEPPVHPLSQRGRQPVREPETSWENGNRGQGMTQLNQHPPSGLTAAHFFRSK